MRRGLVVGKFLPLHRGHQVVIETALAQVDELAVVVYDTDAPEGGRDSFPALPVEQRAGWIEALYPDLAAIVPRKDPLPDVPVRQRDDPSHALAYANDLRFLGPFTHVFGSDPYLRPFASALWAEWVEVDGPRILMPISGTDIRAHPFEHRAMIDPLVYRDLVRKVVLVGTESTGKTTLATALATKLGTNRTREFGRTLWEDYIDRGDEPGFDDFLRVGRTQYEQEQAAALHADRYLICDTNAFTTLLWSEMYYGTADTRLSQLAWETMYDYEWFLCHPDFPWEQDGYRELEGEKAAALQELHRQKLKEWEIPYTILYGDMEQRLGIVDAVLEVRDIQRELASA